MTRTPGFGRVVASVEATTTVVNTAAETNLFSLTLPASTVLPGDYLHVRAAGTLLNNSGGNVTFTDRFKIGATTLFTSAAYTIGTNASRRKWFLDAVIAVEAAAAQRVRAFHWLSNAVTDTWAAQAALAGILAGYAAATENFATSLAIVMSVQMGTAATTADKVLEFATLEHFRRAP